MGAEPGGEHAEHFSLLGMITEKRVNGSHGSGRTEMGEHTVHERDAT